MREGLHLFQSNSFAVLRARLLEDLEQVPTDPFTPEHIIVPGTAVRSALELACAQHFGVAANLSFNFLAQWIWEQIGRFVPVSRESPFTGERLAWRLYRAFGEPAFTRAETRLARYLAHAERDPVMRFELAQRVARVLEQCATYRGGWFKAWSAGRTAGPQPMLDEEWFAALWRWLAREMALPSEHPAAAFFEHLRALPRAEVLAAGLPARVALFCPGDIAPLYLEVLARLGTWMEIRIYLQNPCREYWDLIVGRRRLAQLNTRNVADRHDDYHEVGHPLLASWGRQTQGLITLLGDIEGVVGEDAEFRPRHANTLLATVQNRILDLEHAAGEGHTLAADDRSIRIHVCHSLVRQLEVLHDQLLDHFATQPSLRADQVLVVMPDLARHAPLVHAVFGSMEAKRRIPYRLVGLPRAEANAVARGLLMLLDLLVSRCHASEVFHLLREPLVSARFALDEAWFESLHEWIDAADVRWGLSAAHRERLGMPATAAYTLAEGLDRLCLGFALPEGAEPWAGLLPVAAAEGTEAAALGALDAYCLALEDAQVLAATPAPAAEWGIRLESWLDTFFHADRDSAEDVAEVRSAVQALVADLLAAGLEETLPLGVMQAALKARLEDPAHGAVPTGAVTFAGMTPMRHLPCEIICVLGMDDGVFPALEKPDEFDLLARSPQPGDRQRRLDDRNLFLDLLLAAGSCLHVSYTGRHIRDDSPLTPSVLVSELLEHLGEIISGTHGAEATAAARQHLVVEHPLQAFSTRYFAPDGTQDQALFSYATEYLKALASRENRDSPPVSLAVDAPAMDVEDGAEEADDSLPGTPFFSAPLPAPDPAVRHIDLGELLNFFRHPARHLLRQSLQVTLREAEEELSDEEPFGLEWASRQMLVQRLLPALHADMPDADILALAMAGRELPTGALGRNLFRRELPAMRAYAAGIPAARPGPPAWSATGRFEVQVQKLRVVLEDTLQGWDESGLVCHRYAPANARDKLETWLKHLFFNAAHVEGPFSAARITRWIGRGPGFVFQPCAEASDLLSRLLTLYASGLSLPLRFVPRTAHAYVTKLDKGREQALRAAYASWLGSGDAAASWGARGEGDSPAWRIALRNEAQPLDESFERAACLVFEPLLAHLTEDF